VGDVGVIRDSGNFMSLFNVFRSRDDPVNAIYGVPDGFQPLELFENLYYTAVGSHKPNTRIFSRHTHELKLDASGTALASCVFDLAQKSVAEMLKTGEWL